MRCFSVFFLIQRAGYNKRVQGVFWAVLVAVTSALNDVIVKYVGLRLEPSQVAFYRFFSAR